MQLGDWQLQTVSGGRFKLDGGAMFGVVPKPAWSRKQPADEQNRIRLATNCVLARNSEHTLLIDTGYGGKESERDREQMELEPGEPLVASLAARGVGVEDIDLVVFSHLHFDHAGGGTRRDDSGRIVPTFPKAMYVANRREWEDATSRASELRGAYFPDYLLPLEDAGQLRLVDGEEEIVPGLWARHTGGHTRGHHVLIFRSGDETAIYMGDLCPTWTHARQLWNMGYDTFPLETRRQKPKLLGDATDNGWLVLSDHDPDFAAVRLARDERKEFAPVEKFVTLE